MATWAVTSYFQTVFGNERVVYATLLASGSYTSGGDTINASQFGLDYVDFANVSGAVVTSAGGTTGFVGVPIASFPANSFKLQLFGTGASNGAALAEPSGSIANYVATIEVRGA